MRNCSQRVLIRYVRKPGTRLALTARIKLEMEKWGKVVRDANLKTE
jgi:hypothetical protein